MYKYVILGAGPSALSFAHGLIKQGETSFILLEKEEVAGGLCRSISVDKSPLDIGGGHFLDIRNKIALDLLFEFLPREEWVEYKRISKIQMKNYQIDYPFESNIWQMPLDEKIEFIISICNAGCNNKVKPPENFNEWIYWKLGDKIANEYMIPYNEKIWSIELDKLGIYWLNKLPNVSSRETLKSCLNNYAYGEIPAHGVFLYPRNYGYGEVFKRMGTSLGEKVIYNEVVKEIDLENKTVNKKYQYENLINTTPWKSLKFDNIQAYIENLISKLEYSTICIDYYKDNLDTDAHWTYYPNKELGYHRILHRHNFCTNSSGYWTETNSKRVREKSDFNYVNEFAYPLNTMDKPEIIKEINEYFKKKNVYGLGRWGEWEHINSDIAITRGLDLSNYFKVSGEIL